MLTIKNLNIEVNNELIVHHLSLHIQPGQIHAFMGPNGSGKSSLALTIMGHPRYKITSGSITFNNHEISDLAPEKRAQLGIFLTFQHPYEIPGLPLFTFLKESYYAFTCKEIEANHLRQEILSLMAILELPLSFLDRNLNEGFSGGEKKKFEILQLLLLKPKLAILDEIDSGLDIDALKKISQALLFFKNQNPQSSFLLITHYQRILNYLIPDVVNVLINGKISQTGDSQLGRLIERQGYNVSR